MYEEYLLTWIKPIMNGTTPCARGGHSMIFHPPQLVLFGGHFFGSDSRFQYLNDTYALHLETSTWNVLKTSGTPPSPRYNHSCSLVGPRMFIFGGKGPQGPLNDMYFLDLDEWTWYHVQWSTACPSPRFAHAHTLVGSKLVIQGGWDGKHSKGDLWLFDTDHFTWLQPETVGNGPGPRQGHSLSFVEDTLLVFGGYTVAPAVAPVYHNDTWILETESMSWRRPPLQGTLPRPRFGHGIGQFAEMLFVVGGWAGTQKATISEGDKVLRQQRREKARAQRLVEGVTGPDDGVAGTSDFVHIFNGEHWTWEQPPGAGVRVDNRYGHSVTLVGPHLFVFGGWDGSKAVNELVVAELPVEEAA